MTGNEKTPPSSHLLAQMEGSRFTIQLHKVYQTKMLKSIPLRKICGNFTVVCSA